MILATQITQVLFSIESELRRIDQWQTQAPEPLALQNQNPFCIDSLEFTQWLQWVLIPKMKHIIDNQLALPEHCAILPYAEEALVALDIDPKPLLRLIDELDRLITTHRGSTTVN